MGIRHVFIVSSLKILLSSVVAQESSPDFNEAKESLIAKQYTVAEQKFYTLQKNGPLDTRALSSFYLGVCSYYQERYKEAQAWFQEVLTKYPDLPIRDNIHYWRALCYYADGHFTKVLVSLEPIRSSFYKKKALQLKEKLLEELSFELQDIRKLASAYTHMPYDTVLAKQLAYRIRISAETGSHEALIEDLLEESLYRDQISKLIQDYQQPTTYRVALLLPFFVEDFEHIPFDKWPKSFVWDFYKGVLSAQETLSRDTTLRTTFQLYPYDTQRSSEETQKVLDPLTRQSVDLVVGPLYWEAIEVAQRWSEQQGIALLNPISSTPRLWQRSEYTWLLEADYLRKNQVALTYIDSSFTNKKFAVFCERNMKSIAICEDYVKEAQRVGFHLAYARYLSAKEASTIRDMLVAGVSIDSLEDTDHETTALDLETLNSDNWRPLDTLGHIFVAASHPSFLSYAISGVEIRPDTIPIFTESHWLLEDHFDYEQLERLEVSFVAGNYVDWQSPATHLFIYQFTQRWGEAPNHYACLGYELGIILQNMMDKYGTEFMHAFERARILEGKLGVSALYKGHKSNRRVKIIRIIDGIHQIVYEE